MLASPKPSGSKSLEPFWEVCRACMQSCILLLVQSPNPSEALVKPPKHIILPVTALGSSLSSLEEEPASRRGL